MHGPSVEMTLAPRITWQSNVAPGSPLKAQVGLASRPVLPGPEAIVGGLGAERSSP
jgi:hypothetical protein